MEKIQEAINKAVERGDITLIMDHLTSLKVQNKDAIEILFPSCKYKDGYLLLEINERLKEILAGSNN